MSGVRLKRKLDANAAQGLLSAQQPLRDIGYLLQRTRERLQQAVASLNAPCKPQQRARLIERVAGVLQEVVLDHEATSTYLDSLTANVVPEGAVALGGWLTQRVYRRLNPSPPAAPSDETQARIRILEAAHEAATCSSQKKKQKKKKQNNKHKKNGRASPDAETTTQTPAPSTKRVRIKRVTDVVGGSTTTTTTTTTAATTPVDANIDRALRERVLKNLPQPKNGAQYSPPELTTILLANFPDGNFRLHRSTDDPACVQLAVRRCLQASGRVPIEDRALRKFVTKHAWGSEISTPPEAWAQRGPQPLVNKGDLESFLKDWFANNSKGGVLEEPDLVQHLTERMHARQASRHGGNGAVDASACAPGARRACTRAYANSVTSLLVVCFSRVRSVLTVVVSFFVWRV
jgi:hypothetical protein